MVLHPGVSFAAHETAFLTAYHMPTPATLQRTFDFVHRSGIGRHSGILVRSILPEESSLPNPIIRYGKPLHKPRQGIYPMLSTGARALPTPRHFPGCAGFQVPSLFSRLRAPLGPNIGRF